MTGGGERRCPFCAPDPDRVFYRGRLVIGLWDAFPVSPGHALLTPLRHVPDWFDATEGERAELLEGLDAARQEVLKQYEPEGFNIGVNVGAAAGQTVPHLHVHLIPRYANDVPDPTGGVRAVIPGKANYLTAPGVSVGALPGLPHQGSVVRGESDPFLPHLTTQLDRCMSADIAVAFVLRSGVARLVEHMRDLLVRGGRLRLIAGDYFGVTEPEALAMLLDLQGRVELRVFETAAGSFHPKAYVFHSGRQDGVAYVGSSNLTATALGDGVEWNYRVVSSRDAAGFGDVVKAFDELFVHPRSTPLTAEWIDAYRRRRRTVPMVPVELPRETPEPPPEPHAIQRQALTALEATRRVGNAAGLVVLATGLGKTWLSAFDCSRPDYGRVLFVAHREEILDQAMATFRRVRPLARLGRYTGERKDLDADVLFASVQTLGRQRHLDQFETTAFDYVIVDEFHHASAPTYRRLIEHFEPKFLLGLTATPERTDGGDLLSLCDENLVFRCDVREGIRHELLCPFHYFGVPDEVDYANIPWRNSRFDEEALTAAVATQKRSANVLEQYRKRAGSRTIAFCCSQRHADYMAEFFRANGVRAVAVHSGVQSAPRATSLEQLQTGALDVVCAVDMFNEGVDLPALDTVMMLRPTESRIIWLQQFGRGLRRAAGKPHLTVIDYIGNHRAFLAKPRALLGLGDGFRDLALALDRIQDGTAELPPGCSVTYDLAAIDILRSLLPPGRAADLIEEFYADFREGHGARPTAVECFHDGYNPRALRTAHGSWLRFVQHMGDLSEQQRQVIEQHGGLLEALETTPLSRSYKLVTLQVMIAAGQLPGSMAIAALTEGARRMFARSGALRADVGADLGDPPALQRLLEKNPIQAWTSGKGTAGGPYFAYEGGAFRTTFDVPVALREAFAQLVREILDWRMGEYLGRLAGEAIKGADAFLANVSQASGRPIVFLPDRARVPCVPRGKVALRAGDHLYEADFVKIALNVIRDQGSKENRLPEVLRSWFGDDAGQPGTSHRVRFHRDGEEWVIAPEGPGEVGSAPE